MVVLDIHDIQSLNISNTHVFSLSIAQDEGIVWNQHSQNEAKRRIHLHRSERSPSGKSLRTNLIYNKWKNFTS